MKIGKNNELITSLKEAGYQIKDDFYDKSSLVAEFPIHYGKNIRSEQEVSMWEQFSLAAFLQKHWADNQVSSTIKFDPEKEGRDIANYLEYFQYQLKGISMLTKRDKVYEQPPLEPITRDDYIERIRYLKPINFSKIKHEKADVDKFCNNDIYEVTTQSSLEKLVKDPELGGFVENSDELMLSNSNENIIQNFSNERGVICQECGGIMAQTSPNCFECNKCGDNLDGCGM